MATSVGLDGAETCCEPSLRTNDYIYQLTDLARPSSKESRLCPPPSLPSQLGVILTEVWLQQMRQGIFELISCLSVFVSLCRQPVHQRTPAAVLSRQASPTPPLSFPPVLIISSSRDDCTKPGYKFPPHITQEGFIPTPFLRFSSLSASGASGLSNILRHLRTTLTRWST